MKRSRVIAVCLLPLTIGGCDSGGLGGNETAEYADVNARNALAAVNSLQSRVEELESDKDELEARLSDAESNIRDANSEISRLESEIGRLESELSRVSRLSAYGY